MRIAAFEIEISINELRNNDVDVHQFEYYLDDEYDPDDTLILKIDTDESANEDGEYQFYMELIPSVHVHRPPAVTLCDEKVISWIAE